MPLYRGETSKRTTKKRYFEELERELPMAAWLSMIEPHYAKTTNNGRPRKELEIVLRAYIYKMCYNLSDEAWEDELQENITVRNFYRIISEADIPDHTTLWRFEQLLTEHDLQEKLFRNQGHLYKPSSRQIPPDFYCKTVFRKSAESFMASRVFEMRSCCKKTRKML